MADDTKTGFDLAGNPHVERALEYASAGDKAVVEALLAVAFEIRTANLQTDDKVGNREEPLARLGKEPLKTRPTRVRRATVS